jgi:iron complex outermembrane recepter protein
MGNRAIGARSSRALANRLLYGTAVAGLCAFSASNAFAQTQTAANVGNETVVVTGTSIQGLVAPVGSNVITIDRDAIQSSGATTVQSLLTNVPEVTGFGNAGQGSYGSFDGSNSNAPTIHSLGASASNSTLILVDGHRLPLGGLAHSLSDPSIIAPIALQRVEVLPDGASSIYGSDAVAGVLNFITRKNYEGAETQMEYGSGIDYNTFTFGQLLGHTWDTGGVMAAYNFVSRSDLLRANRSFVRGNQTYRGLSNFDNFNCSPATISPTAGTGAGLIFNYPYTGTGVANTTANAYCDQNNQGALLPSENRNNAFISVHQDITPDLTLSADFAYSNRVDNMPVARGTVTATVFGPASGKGTQINPFFVDIPGSNDNTETVRYDFQQLLGPGARTKANDLTMYATPSVTWRPTGDWQVSLDTVFGYDDAASRTVGTVCAACAYLALNGSTHSNGSLTTSSTPTTLNTTTITSRPLTTANALNVWGASGATAAGGVDTSSDVLSQLVDNNNYATTQQNMDEVDLKASGSLFSLPAGDIKTAFGTQYRHYGITQYTIQNGASGPSSTNSTIFNASFARSIYAVYAEFFLPIISPNANVPLVQKFDLDVSGRFDDYSDVGSTSNPKIGIDWDIIDGLKARGSYGTSFVAPALTSTGGAAGLTTEAAVNYGNGIGGPVTLPAGYANNGGGNSTLPVGFCATGCTIGTAVNQGIFVTGPGGLSVKPETATSYSAGVDIAPGTWFHSLDGLLITATYWQAKYQGAITAPIMSLSAQLAPLNKNIILAPSDAQIAAVLASGRRIASLPSGPITFIQYYTQQNAFNLQANGIDFAINYAFSTDGAGDFNIGLDGSDKLRFQQEGGPGAPWVDNLNKNANTTFSSLALLARASFGWHLDPFAVDFFLNYTNSYKQPTTTAPFKGYYQVPSQITVDMHLAYDLPSDNQWLSGTQLYVDGSNIFNQPPPPYNSANGYDTTDASPLGRIISVGLRKNW